MRNFIEEYFISASLCEQIIEAFESREDLRNEGKIGGGIVDKDRKDSTDAALENFEEFFHLYFGEIIPFFRDYCQKYEIDLTAHPMRFSEPSNIQRYLPNQGYFVQHQERSAIEICTVTRELVFMTYLNTIEDFSENQGATVFPFQDLYVQPKIGKTLIWPAGFTHQHYGITHKTEKKYIITGWKHSIPNF